MIVEHLNWGRGRNIPGEDTVTAALNDAVRTHAERPAGVKALVIILDDRDHNYDTSYWNAGMKGSEIVALLEVFKQRVLRSMNVPPL